MPRRERVKYFRKLFARGIGGKADPILAEALRRAARYAAQAEVAFDDPSVSYDHYNRLEAAADHAQRRVERMIEESERSAPGPDDDAELMAMVRS